MPKIVKLSLRSKLLFFFIVLAIIPLGVSSWNMITITQDELKSAANEELSSTAVQIAAEIDNFYINTWAAPLMMIKDALDNERLGAEEKLSLLTLGVQEIADIVALQLDVEGFAQPFLVIKEDFQQALSQTGLNPAEILALPKQQILSQSQPETVTTGPLEYFTVANIWLTSLTVPLRGRLQGRSAILTARIDLNRLKTTIEKHPFAKTNKITLFEADGKKIFDPERRSIQDLPIAQEALSLLNSGSRAVGVHHYTAPDGQAILGAYAFPLRLNWGITVEKQKKLAYLAVTKMVHSLYFWVILGFAVAVLTAVIVAYSLTTPLHRLTKAAKTLSSGDFSAPITGKERSDEIGMLSLAFTKMVAELKHYIEVLTETTKQKERAESELRLARDIQRSFLPTTFPKLNNLDFCGRCDPAREVGGDFFDYVKLNDHTYGFAIGDVSGKGVPAALFMAMSRTLFHMISRRKGSPQSTLEELNRRLVELDPSGNLFITIFYGVIDTQERKMFYSTAGHNMPFIRSAANNEGKFVMLPRMKTMVAGIMDDIALMSAELPLTGDDIIVLYTDGMTEALNLNNKDFGESGMMKLLDDNYSQSAKRLCEISIDGVNQFQTGMPQFDDMTIFIIKFFEENNKK